MRMECYFSHIYIYISFYFKFFLLSSYLLFLRKVGVMSHDFTNLIRCRSGLPDGVIKL